MCLYWHRDSFPSVLRLTEPPYQVYIHVYILLSYLSYSLKFLRLKIFVVFTGPSKATKVFSREIFSSIADSGHGWKLDGENFICENLFLSRIGQKREIQMYLPLENFRLYGISCPPVGTWLSTLS